jgi:hypothetical protein
MYAPDLAAQSSSARRRGNDSRAQFLQAPRIAVAHERRARARDAIDDDPVPLRHRKQSGVRLPHAKVVDEASSLSIVDSRPAAPEYDRCARDDFGFVALRRLERRRDAKERGGGRMTAHHRARRRFHFEQAFAGQNVVRKRYGVARHAQLFGQGPGRRNAARGREDPLGHQLPDLISNLRLQRRGAVLANRERQPRESCQNTTVGLGARDSAKSTLVFLQHALR